MAGAVAAPFPHPPSWFPATWPAEVRAALCQLTWKVLTGTLVLPKSLVMEPLSQHRGSRKKPGVLIQHPQGFHQAEQTDVFQAV